MIRKIKIILFSVFAAAGLLIAGVYFGIVFILPEIVNSKAFQTKTADFIYKKYNLQLILNDAKLSISPGLKFNIKAEEIKAKSDNKDIFLINNIKAEGRFKTLKSLKAEYLFFDNNFLTNKKHKTKNGFHFSKLPDIYLKNGDIRLNNFDIRLTNFNVFDSCDNIGQKTAIFKAEGKSDFLYRKIILDGEFLINRDDLISKGSKVFFGGSALNIEGRIFSQKHGEDFQINGKMLPVDELMAWLLFYQKSEDNNKKFIENFKNYNGTLDVNLSFKNKKLYGKLIANDLSATTVLFNAPVYFKRAEFYFNGEDLTSSAIGTLAGERAAHILNIKNVTNKEREVFGEVYSNLTNKGARYVPGLEIIDSVKIGVNYHIKNKKDDINYSVDIKKGADIVYKGAYLGLRDKNRKVYIETFKDKDLSIKNYDYSIINGNTSYNIISGDGLFIKKTGVDKKEHLHPKYLSAKTNGFAPASFTGSFGKYIEGGEFKGNLKYDFEDNLILGDFIIRDFTHKDFYVKEAKIDADKDFINILAGGEYKRSDFTCKIKAKNHIADKIKVYTMDLFLDKYIFKNHSSGKFKHRRFHPKNKRLQQKNFYNKVRDIDLEIDDWSIGVGELIKDRINLKNILLKGSLINNMFNFSTSDILFANGKMSASGKYDFKTSGSEINFIAQNIDSNIAADILFNIPGQIEGIADGLLSLETSNKFNDIKAYVEFQIDDGNITKLGDVEFLTRHGKKIKISDIINIDTNNNKALSSDIKGKFYFDNYKIYNIDLTSKQKYLAFLIKGSFDIKKDNADLMLFGKYNSTAGKGIKILFIPISFILKFIFRPEYTFKNYKPFLNKIPDIEGKKEEINYFRMFFKGNLKDRDIELKSIME